MRGFPIVGTGIAMPGIAGVFNLAVSDLSATPGLYDPSDDDFIPKRQRRRMSRLSCMAIRSIREAGGLDATESTPLVFATANGEINTIGSILVSLLGPENSISPTLFHNSVHNAPSGYWSILAKHTAPITTITMGDLSFEYAMLDAWARLSSGRDDGQVLVTAGDEAVVTPSWADPPHCNHDFCGSLLLAGGAVGEGKPESWILRHVGRSICSDPVEAEAIRHSLEKEFEPTDVRYDMTAIRGPGSSFMPGGATNPCSGLYALLRFIHGSSSQGTLLLLKAGREGELFHLVVSKNAAGVGMVL